MCDTSSKKADKGPGVWEPNRRAQGDQNPKMIVHEQDMRSLLASFEKMPYV